jgi:uncharacterized protein YceK
MYLYWVFAMVYLNLIACAGHSRFKNIVRVSQGSGCAKRLKFGVLGLVAGLHSGCAAIGAAVMNGPTCPYQGVQLDFHAATDWTLIKGSNGLIIPLAIIDLPFSFVFDTLTLGSALEAGNGELNCPRKFT